MKTVIISGGTGLVGKELSKILIQQGYKVIILSRNIDQKPNADHLQFALWDVDKQKIDIEAIRSADIIVHLAGAPVLDKKWTTSYKKEINDSRTESSRLIFESLKNIENKVKVVISASAIGWYGSDTEPVKPFTEDAAADAGFLGQTCKRWEESIEPVATLGKRLVKFRIGIVLSNKGGALPAFKGSLQFGVAAILGNGRQMISWIHIEDLCRLIITAIENENLTGCYNAVTPFPVNNKSLTITLAQKMNRKFFVPVPIPACIIKLMMGQRSTEVLKSCTVSAAKITGTGFVFRFPDMESSLENLLSKGSKI